MKHHFTLTFLLLALIVSVANVQAEPASATDVLGNVQDERLADVKAVQTALQGEETAEAKVATLAAFQQRESLRATQAGPATLQIELARQSTSDAAVSQEPATTTQREITTTNSDSE